MWSLFSMPRSLKMLEGIGVDYIDESEVLTPADEEHHIYKHDFKVPFVCGCRNLGEALRRLGQGAGKVRMPVVNSSAGGVATPADAALMMQLGVDGVFVGSGIFKSGDPAKRAVAIVKAVTHYNDPYILAEVSRNLGEPMVGRNVSTMPEVERIAGRGW